MTRQKNYAPWVSLALSLWWSTFIPMSSNAQSCGGSLQTVTYDTIITGAGSQNYSLPLHQYFSSQGYTLISAEIQAYLTTTASAQFQNNTATTQSFTPNISRGDEVDLNGSYLASGAAAFNFAHANIIAGATKTYPTQTVFNHYHIIDDLIDNSDPTLNIFQGIGTVSLSYASATFINNVPLGVVPSSAASDNIVFSVTYTFCNPVILSSDFLTFTAKRQDIQSVTLNWTVGNETAGRRYDIEVSQDGSKFAYYRSLTSDPSGGDASYVYGYYIAPGSQGKLYFRLKQVEKDGPATYSPVRIIDLNEDGGSRAFMIYPNPPTDYINVVFPGVGGGWQVDILSPDGGLVQRSIFNAGSSGRVNFSRKLAPGTYFLRATDLQSSVSHAASFIMR